MKVKIFMKQTQESILAHSILLKLVPLKLILKGQFEPKRNLEFLGET